MDSIDHATLDVSAGDSVDLADLPGVWRVVSGEGSVFVSLRDTGGTGGASVFLTDAPMGFALVGGVQHGEGEEQFQGLLTAHTQMTLVHDPEPDFDALSAWVSALSRDIGSFAPSTPAALVLPSPCDVTSLEAGTVFRTEGGPHQLLEIVEGRVTLHGGDRNAMPPDGVTAPRYLLTTPDIPWVAGPDGATLAVRDPARQPPETLRAGVENLGALWWAARREALMSANRQEALRIAEARQQRIDGQRSAVEALRVDAGDALEQTLRKASDDPWTASMQIIGVALDIEMNLSPMDRQGRSLGHRLASTAAASGARMRRIDLTADWMTGDAGLILAAEADTGTPVIFVPRTRRMALVHDYLRISATEGSIRPATPQDAEAVAPMGYSFAPGLPTDGESGAVGFWDVVSFVLQPNRKDIALLGATMLLSTLLGLLVPVAHFLIVDRVIPNDERALLLGIGVSAGALVVAIFVFNMAQQTVNMRLQAKITGRLQPAIMDRVLRLPTGFFRSMPTGELMNRVLMVSGVSVGTISTLSGSLSAALGAILMIGMCFVYSVELALIALVAALGSALVTFGAAYFIRRRAIDIELISGRNMGQMMQIVSSIPKLQAAGAETRAFQKWADGKGQELSRIYQNARIEAVAGLVTHAIRTLAMVALFYVAGTMVLDSAEARALDPLLAPALTIGTFFAVQKAFTSVIDNTERFFTSFVDLFEHSVRRDLITPILESEIEQSGERLDPGVLTGEVALHDLSFRYHDAGPLILDRISLSLNPGESLAIVGPSGAGKSTLLSLILGFERPTGGMIQIDGRPLTSLDLTAVRAQIGVVLQNDRIAGGTIFSAIAGASNIGQAEAWVAAKDAGFDEDIKAMPMGMHAIVPEGGGTLSGGQRQRLAIARALAQNPRVILFDEATSALDNRTQAIVTQSLDRRNVTRIVIAHRFSTIENLDKVAVLERGRLVELGTPAELLAKGGLFASLARAQDGDGSVVQENRSSPDG